MTDPIEIMARAIHDEIERLENDWFDDDCVKWERTTEGKRRERMHYALAALSALHEAGFVVVPTRPTPVMKKSGARVTGNYDIAHECFVQMIAAAQVPHDKA